MKEVGVKRKQKQNKKRRQTKTVICESLVRKKKTLKCFYFEEGSFCYSKTQVIFYSNYQGGVNVIGFSNFLVPVTAANSFVNLNTELQLQVFVNTVVEFAFIQLFIYIYLIYEKFFLSPIQKGNLYRNQNFFLSIQWE